MTERYVQSQDPIKLALFHVFLLKICSFGIIITKITLKLTLVKDKSFAPT